MAGLLYPAIRMRGVIGVAGLSAGVAVVDFVLSAFLTNRILGASWTRYVSILLPMLVASSATALLGHTSYIQIRDVIHPFLAIPLTGGLALALYFGLMYLYDPELRAFASEMVQGFVQEVRDHLAERRTKVSVPQSQAQG
jgi:hypothetical protein